MGLPERADFEGEKKAMRRDRPDADGDSGR